MTWKKAVKKGTVRANLTEVGQEMYDFYMVPEGSQPFHEIIGSDRRSRACSPR